MKKRKKTKANGLISELLILPDGRVFVQSLTQPMAEILRQLNPQDPAIAPRVKISGTYELPN